MTRGIQLSGLGFEWHAQGTIGRNLERMPALQAGFYSDEERAFLSSGKRGASNARERFPNENRARLEGRPRANREGGDANAEHRAWPDAQGEGTDITELQLGFGQGDFDAAEEAFQSAIRRKALTYPATARENTHSDSSSGGAVEDEAGFGRTHGLS
ncbi:MAG: hypothetical protein RL309_1373, partial [Verrucomicrobiota bacterium]